MGKWNMDCRPGGGKNNFTRPLDRKQTSFFFRPYLYLLADNTKINYEHI